MKKEFAKVYEPQKVEKKWYDIWIERKAFRAENNSGKKTYSILMPPPNVTGILHFGHVLNQTLQDLYLRWKKALGYEVCWFPGTDHAGIATQSKVEAELRKENMTRYDLGREKFIERVWQWREKYGGIIVDQLKKLGVACDWDRELFTMDESASNAVREVFIRLFDEGLIYKGKKIINWSPLAQTALSDEEVERREVRDKLYTMKYYFEGEDRYLKVATVRPETIFGDVAVAVNPKDERYSGDLGKRVIVPLVGRPVEIIADDYADPEFGTGCVKITPAHDPNDFAVGERHDLEIIATINPDGRLNERAGEFDGLDRFEARKAIVKKLEELELIENIEDYSHSVGYSQRGGEPVEPFLSDQWFVDMKPLAESSIKVVSDGEIKFYPDHWVKTYEHWMTNIRDWCISRQLWWGHRIPVYYAEDGRYTAAKNEDEACRKLELPAGAPLRQEEDVLDTWFSSWLWPLTTMRWRGDGESETTPDLEEFLPTDLLVTAPDIIFFWVARMIIATKKFKGEIPFKDVYFTSMIRDGKGRKLSKSLGNSPDPLNIIEKYGADAARFTMIYLSPLGQDVRMEVDVEAQDIPSMEIGRNFANKVWNAGRFLLMKADMVNLPGCCPSKEGRTLEYEELTYPDKWILSRCHSVTEKLNKALENYKVNDYSRTLHEFVWRDFCDWYVEIVKTQIDDAESSSYKQALMRFAMDIYDSILKLLHPVMPFITEEIWHLTGERGESEFIGAQPYPISNREVVKPEIETGFALVQLVVEEIRSVRAGANIPPAKKLPVTISSKKEKWVDILSSLDTVIARLARASSVKVAKDAPKPEQSLASVVREVEIFVEIAGAIDVDKEKARLQKEIERLMRNIGGSEKKLSNEKFVANAPANIVEHERTKLAAMKESLKKVRENFNDLS